MDVSQAILADPSKPGSRWGLLTPNRLVILVLIVEGLLLFSDQFGWFAFNQYKGWTVLIAAASVGVALLLVLCTLAASLLCAFVCVLIIPWSGVRIPPALLLFLPA